MLAETVSEPRHAGLREVATMAFPIILAMMSHTIMQFVDQWMVAQLGTSALAAVGSAGIWSFVIAAFIIGTVGCVATFAAQSLGKGNPTASSAYAWQGIYVAIVGGIISVGLWPLAAPMFGLFGHSADVTQLEVVYFQIRLFSYGFIAWQAVLAAFFQAVNRPRIPMYATFAANLLNIGLDYVLIFGKFGFPQLGIAGAAIATVIALAIQAVMLQAIFMTPSFERAFHTRRAWRFDRAKMAELLHIGWPGGASFLLDVMIWALFTSLVIGRFGGDGQLAAHNAALSFMHVSFMPCVGLSQALTPIVGQWIGRGSIPTAKARVYTAMKMAIPYMTTMGIVFAVFGPYLMRLFTQDPDIIRLGHQLLIIAAVFQGFDGINITLIGALRGAGDTRWTMWAIVLLGYPVFLPLATALAIFLPVAAVGAWIGATIYILLVAVVFFRRFHYEGWRSVRIFREDQATPQPEIP